MLKDGEEVIRKCRNVGIGVSCNGGCWIKLPENTEKCTR